MTSEWRTNHESIVICGRTGSGKSTLAKTVHSNSPRISIWLNEKGADREPRVSGKRVRTPRALESGLRDGISTYNWISSNRERDVQALQKWCWRKYQVAKDRGVGTPKFQIIIDEAHREAPQTNKKDVASRDAIRRLMREGRKRGVKTILCSQQVQSLDKQSIRERGYLCAFELSIEQQRYMRDYGVDVNDVQDLKDYSCIVYRADGTVEERNVRGDSRYA